jgi:hypothetical protein
MLFILVHIAKSLRLILVACIHMMSILSHFCQLALCQTIMKLYSCTNTTTLLKEKLISNISVFTHYCHILCSGHNFQHYLICQSYFHKIPTKFLYKVLFLSPSEALERFFMMSSCYFGVFSNIKLINSP